MARDTLLGFPAHTLPYRRGKFITLSTASEIAGAPAISFIKKDSLNINCISMTDCIDK